MLAAEKSKSGRLRFLDKDPATEYQHSGFEPRRIRVFCMTLIRLTRLFGEARLADLVSTRDARADAANLKLRFSRFFCISKSIKIKSPKFANCECTSKGEQKSAHSCTNLARGCSSNATNFGSEKRSRGKTISAKIGSLKAEFSVRKKRHVVGVFLRYET